MPMGNKRVLANTLAEVDDFAPVRTRINPANAAALRALEMRANVVPVPVRQVVEIDLGPMPASRSVRRPDAIHQDRFEAVGFRGRRRAARPIA